MQYTTAYSISELFSLAELNLSGISLKKKKVHQALFSFVAIQCEKPFAWLLKSRQTQDPSRDPLSNLAGPLEQI